MKSLRLPANLGMTLLGIWVALFGLIPLVSAGAIAFNFGTLLSVLAVAAGVLILLGR